MSELIVKDPKGCFPPEWLAALASIRLPEDVSPTVGILVWSDDEPTASLTDEDLQREWIVLLDKGASSWPPCLPRVIATANRPWSLEWLKRTIRSRMGRRTLLINSRSNANLIREQERLLQNLKAQLTEKTKERTQELEKSQSRLRIAQQRLIQMNALISALSQANSEEELNTLLTQEIPKLLTSRGPLTEEDEAILDQLKTVTMLISHHKSQLRHARSLSEEWTKTFDSIDDPVALITPDLTIARANQAYQEHKLSALPVDELRPVVQQCLLQRQPTAHELHFRAQDRWYVVRAIPMITRLRANPSHVVLYYRDITSSRHIRQHIIQAEKLTELGVLAGSVAHEINNPLAGILAFVQLTKSALGAEHPAMPDLKEMERAALQCRTIVQNLLSFSRKANLEECGLISMHQILETIAPLIQLQLKHENVQALFHWNRDAKGFFVYGSFNQFLQILLNLSTICLEEGRWLEDRLEFHWSTFEAAPELFTIELTYCVPEGESPSASATTDEHLLHMCRYVTQELVKANEGRLEPVNRPGIRGWGVVLPAANAQKLRTAQGEKSDQL
jgi:signal transduction histidine kinase